MQMSEEQLKELKDTRDSLMRLAEEAAYAYFVECEIGPEREKAGAIFDSLRASGRAY